ncbi:hypothetical protein Dsin_004465 [Dipteronia sinensis]|uniref:Reverse transcriptase zinc-binding domain-containing protein n=1 Tax=Dipteronia sinensis TaxID=43782 RepID=A0AAE0EDQ1_9ROSI|nr:hypothetical protein Dsin_004465 [Dipteronia sinensis]
MWRFGVEVSTLWKKVVCAAYGLDNNLLFWDWQRGPSASHFVKVVSSLYDSNPHTKKILDDGLQVVVGRGDRVRLWLDICCDGIPLSEAFPRIFSLSMDKEGSIQNFGSWRNMSWVWKVYLRRNVFDWEKDQ